VASNNSPSSQKQADVVAQRLAGKVALVTGASRGLGFATAVHLAREGAHIIATARTKGGLEELDDAIKAAGSSATLVPMNITDYEGIDRLGAAIFERWKKLDILIGNAGTLGKLTPLAHVDPKVWDESIGINLTSNYRLIRSMDPLLQAAEHARVVLVTSGFAQKCHAYWGTYSIGKAALEALMKTYAAEVATTTMRVNCFSPGATRTKMRATAMPGEDPETLPAPEDVTAQIVPMCLPEFSDNGGVWKYDVKGLFKQY
jgi:NAD(P)-dependent dehydrogenase (short-subunit alcohol dehydrogenase family)